MKKHEPKNLKCIFVKSAVLPADYPQSKRPEIGIVGRSNAGKSSFINALVGSKISKVSQTPGKTRLLNFFDVGEHYTMVDMPGYGFASRSGDEVISWQEMVERYLVNRSQLCGLLLVMDIRREWDKEERMIKKFCSSENLPMLIVLTKADKLNRQEVEQAINKMKKVSQLEAIFAVNSEKRVGHEGVENYFFNEWVKPMMSEMKRKKTGPQ